MTAEPMFAVIDALTGAKVRASRFSDLRAAFDCGYLWVNCEPGGSRDFKVVDQYGNAIPRSRAER